MRRRVTAPANRRLGQAAASASTWPASNRRESSGQSSGLRAASQVFAWGRRIRGNCARVAGETTMNPRNGSAPAPPNGVAKDMGELTHDIVSLAELQFELFRNDCREGIKGLLMPVALLLFAGIVAAGTIPVALIFLAEVLAQVAGLSRAAAFSVAALGGAVVAAAMGTVGWSRIRGAADVFARSGEELTRNMTWIKHVLKRPATTEGQSPADR